MRHQFAVVLVGILLGAAAPAPAAEPAPPIGLYTAPSSSWPAETIDALCGALGSRANLVRLDARSIGGELDPGRYPLLVVADARRVPAELPEALAAYVHKGGHLALLGGPFFDAPLFSYGDALLDRRQLAEAVAGNVKPAILFDFDSPEFPAWQNHSDRPSAKSAAVRAEAGADGTPAAIQLRVSAEAGWDTFQSPAVDAAPDPEALLVSFWAKGDGPKSQLVIEWRERDGSRWMGTVRLSDQWQHYVLPVEAFAYWHDSVVQGRGAAGDRLHPENVATVTLGLAQSHAAYSGLEGHRTVWVDQIGFARPPQLLRRPADLLPREMTLPVIETASPRYKLFAVTNAKQLRVNAAQQIAGPIDLPVLTEIYAPTARPDGTGLDRDRPCRFVSLIQSLDEHNQPQASPASLLIPAQATHGLVFSIPIADAGFFGRQDVAEWIAGVVGRMLDGLFLLEGGAKYYASFGAEPMPLGAVVVNRGRQPASVQVELAVATPDGRVACDKNFSVSVGPGQQQRVAQSWPVPLGQDDRFQVSVRLLHNNRPIDRIEHTLRVWRPKPSPQFLTARGGDFYLAGQPWFAHGVNYMPSSGTACEDQAAFEFWMDGRAYGQEIIRRDLANLKAIGLNSASAFVYHRSHGDRNLLDFLMQCEDFGIKVNLSLRPGTPLDFRWEEIREMIVANRLAENDTIMAYDLAWEPMWGGQTQRQPFDADWRAWIDRRYGDLAKAEAAWQFAAPRQDNQVVGPPDAQILQDGPWRKMVLDYRRFQNEKLDSAYRRARDLVRSVDPHHLVSFRMTIAGDPTASPSRMAYDPAGLAHAVDIMEPEGYGRIGDWNQVRPGWFTVAYCRAVAPELPVVWAEFGYSVWDPAAGGPAPDKLDFAGRFYDDFLRMAFESGSNGTFCWYSCGGYRVNEKSDYGILGPDGAWRPQTRALHRWAGPVTEPRSRSPVQQWIPIQLDSHVDGVAGIYRQVGESFWKAIDQKQTPGLRIQPKE